MRCTFVYDDTAAWLHLEAMALSITVTPHTSRRGQAFRGVTLSLALHALT
jgi:hypothetical protein